MFTGDAEGELRYLESYVVCLYLMHTKYKLKVLNRFLN